MPAQHAPSGSPSVDRETILQLLDDAMADLAEAIEAAEPKTPEEERLQLRRYHELGYLSNQYRKLSRDLDLVELDTRVELLEANHDANES